MTSARLSRELSLLLVLVLLVGSVALADGFRRDIILIAISFAMCAAATDYASGYAGLRTLGPILPFGIGSYLHGVLMAQGAGFTVGLLVTPVVVAALGGLLCGILVGRRRDVASWAVFGLAASIAVEQVARAGTVMTGGSNGLLVSRYFGGAAMGEVFAIGVAVAACAGLFWLIGRTRGSNGAKILLAHFEPDRLETHGVSLARTRIVVTAGHWGIAALAGLVFAATTGAIDPSIFGIQNNLTILIACTLFGERTIVGPAAAAFLLVILENLAGSVWSGWQTMILGLALIAVLLWRNGGGTATRIPHPERSGT